MLKSTHKKQRLYYVRVPEVWIQGHYVIATSKEAAKVIVAMVGGEPDQGGCGFAYSHSLAGSEVEEVAEAQYAALGITDEFIEVVKLNSEVY